MKTYTAKQLCDLLQIGLTTLKRMRKADEIPAPIATNRRILRWRQQDIHDWVASKQRENVKFKEKD